MDIEHVTKNCCRALSIGRMEELRKMREGSIQRIRELELRKAELEATIEMNETYDFILKQKIAMLVQVMEEYSKGEDARESQSRKIEELYNGLFA